MNNISNFFGYVITLIVGVAGARTWEYFFKYKVDVGLIQQSKLEFTIDKLYGGLITKLNESIIKNETKIVALEVKIDKQWAKIESLDRKVTIYENHLLDGSERDKDLVRRTNIQSTLNLT